MTDPRITIAKRELASLRSEKTIVLAILIQLFVAAFSSFLVVGLVSMYDPGTLAGVGLGVAISGDASDELDDALAEVEGLDTEQFESLEQAQSAFENPDTGVDAVVHGTRTDDGRIRVQTTVPDEEILTTVLVVQLQEAFTVLEDQERERNADRLSFSPLSPPDNADPAPYFGFTYTVLIPLLLFLPVFISGSIAVDSVSEELERGTMEILRTAPVSFGGIVDAKLAATAGLAPIQAFAWILLLEFNGTSVSNVLPLLAIVTALAAALVACGLLVSLLTPDRRQAQLVYSLGVLAVFTVSVYLPEHPANTVAKLAIGSPSTGTWIAAAGIVLGGTLLWLVARQWTYSLDPERL